MLRRIMSEFDVKAGLDNVLRRINGAHIIRNKVISTPMPLLVAVSKTKPVETIIEAYSMGQRHFGENYVKELEQKCKHPDILKHCPDIKWHFIGNLQNNKINKIIKFPNLYMIQSVDTEKLANGLNDAWEKLQVQNKQPLRILIQVNTSGEAVKHGITPLGAPLLFKNIRENLKNISLDGVMTIGAFGHDYTTGPNPDFVSLMDVHQQICEGYDISKESVLVSMGMSNDFDKAIEMGSTIVRVGTSIFGYRAPKTK